jgi:6-phosphogluconolactonase
MPARPSRSFLTLILLTLTFLLLTSCGNTTTPAPEPEQPAAQNPLVYFGTNTRGDSTSKGIYVSRLNTATGELTPPELAAETPNPTFLAIHPNKKYVYAANEIDSSEGKPGGTVSAFSIGDGGKLTLLNTVSTRGGGPCHLNVDATGKCLVVANYGGGSVAAMPLNPDGSLQAANGFFQHEGSSANPNRQKGPHAHSVNFSPNGAIVVAADLGLDKLLIYRVNPATAALEANDPPSVSVAPGSGPRHFSFHPTGNFAYVINELLSTVTAFSWEAQAGTLTELQTISTLPDDFDGRNSTAEIRVHPSGKFVYGSNRGHNSIAVFDVNQENGTLTFVERVASGGETPRNFCIDPSGGYMLVANQGTDNVVAFKLSPETGRLTPTGQELSVGKPVCVRFVEVQ